MAEHCGGVRTGESSSRKYTVPPPRPTATEFLRSLDRHSTGDGMKLICCLKFSAAFPYDYSLARVRVKRGGWWMIPLRRNVDSGNMEFEGTLWKLFLDHYKIRRTFTLSVIYEGFHNFQIKVYDNDWVRVKYYKDDFRCACYGPCDVDDGPTDNVTQGSAGFDKEKEESKGGDVQLKEGDTFHHPTADIAPPPAWCSFNVAYFRTSRTNHSPVFVARGQDAQRLKQMPTGPWMVSYAGAEFPMEVLSNTKQNRNFGSGWKEFIDMNVVEKGSLIEMRVPNAWQHVIEANITRH